MDVPGDELDGDATIVDVTIDVWVWVWVMASVIVLVANTAGAVVVVALPPSTGTTEYDCGTLFTRSMGERNTGHAVVMADCRPRKIRV